MKKFFAIAALLALTFSCNKEGAETDTITNPDEISEGVEVTEFGASIPEVDSKTYLSEKDGSVWHTLWGNGDAININGVASNALSTGDGYVDTNYARFTMASGVTSQFYYAYPASRVSAWNSGSHSATITVPTTQSWVSGQYDPSAYIMVGNGTSSQLSFQPVMGLIDITTTAPASGTLYVEKVRVEAIGSEKMSGAFTTDYSTISGGATNYVDVDAGSSSRKAFGTHFIAAIPAQTYASGLRITIYANTASSGSGTQKIMVFSKQSSMTVDARTKYPITAPAFKESAITATVTSINSSTLGISWSGANASNNKVKPWNILVYSDSGCNTLVRTISIPANAACWTSGMTSSLAFAIGGLSQNTTYYFKVKDVQNNVTSAAASGKTAAFSIVSMTSIGSSTTGTVFAEDFSELCAFGVKYNGQEFGGCYNNTAAKRLDASDWASLSFVEPENAEWKLYNSGLNSAVTGKRFAGWLGQGNAIAKCGYLKLGGASEKGWALTPAFTIASGYMAVVTVTVNAAKYDASTIAHSISVVHTAGSGTAARESNFTWVPAPDLDQRFDDKNASSTAWADIVTTGLYLHDGDRILFGSTESSGTENQRILMNSIKVEVTSVVPEADYLISNYETLKRFMDAVGTSAESGSKTVNGMVTHNISLTTAQQTSIASSYPLAGYTGTLYGQSHTITGLQKPFFADLQGDVEYLTLNSTINATTDTFEEGPAIFAEELAGGGSLDHCTSQGSVTFRPSTAVTGATRYVAGLVGYVSNGTVTNCSNAATVSFPHNSQTNDMIINVGGAIGAINSSTSFSNVSNSGSVSVGVINATSTSREGRIGGVVGYIANASSVSGFNNSGAVSFTGTVYGSLSIGGVIGRSAKALSSCQNSGTITAGGSMNVSGTGGYRYVGGIVGYVSANVNISDNVNTSTGTITNTGSSTGYTLIGGIAGYPQGAVSGGSNAASVSYSGSSGNTVCVGGVAGRTYKGRTGARINNVSNSGNISVTESSSHAGKWFFVSGVSAHHQTGNVLAHNSGTITIENIHCAGVVVGALCGQSGFDSSNQGSILSGSDNSAAGDISVSGITASNICYLGGLVGKSFGSISSASNAGDVSFTSSTGVTSVYVGGLAGTMENVSDTSISGSHNSGAISNEVDSGSDKDISIGGLVGLSNRSISSSYNTGTVSNSGDSGCDMCVGGLVGNGTTGITLTTCYNTGAVSNSGDAATNRIVALGGLVGWSSSCTYASACYNTGSVTNSGEGSNGGQAEGGALSFAKVGVCVGGLVGLANGANTLTSTSSTYNYNNGAIRDNSSSEYVAVGGVCGYAGGAASSFNYCRNQSSGTITISGNKTYIYYGGIAGAFGNASTIDYANNSGSIVASSATMPQTGYLRLGGIIGGWTADACTSQTITGCTNSGSITLRSNTFGILADSNDRTDSYVGGIAGGGNNGSGVCGKALVNCKNSGAITMGDGGGGSSSTNSGKLYQRFCVGGIIGFTDVNPDGSKCIANIRFRTTAGENRIGGIAGEMKIGTIQNVTYKGEVNSNGTSGTNYTGGLVGNVGTGTKTFNNCTVSGLMHGPNSTTTPAGIFCSCKGGGTGPTINITNCKVGSGTKVQTASSGYSYTISSASDITASNVFGHNGSSHSCTAGTNSGNSVVDPSTITL